MKKFVTGCLLALLLFGMSSYKDIPGNMPDKPKSINSPEKKFKPFLPGVYKKLEVPYMTPMQMITNNFTRIVVPPMQPTFANLMWFVINDADENYWENIQDYQVGAYCTPEQRAEQLTWTWGTYYLYFGCTDCSWHIVYGGLHKCELGIVDWYDTTPDAFIVTSNPALP